MRWRTVATTTTTKIFIIIIWFEVRTPINDIKINWYAHHHHVHGRYCVMVVGRCEVRVLLMLLLLLQSAIKLEWKTIWLCLLRAFRFWKCAWPIKSNELSSIHSHTDAGTHNDLCELKNIFTRCPSNNTKKKIQRTFYIIDYCHLLPMAPFRFASHSD